MTDTTRTPLTALRALLNIHPAPWTPDACCPSKDDGWTVFDALGKPVIDTHLPPTTARGIAALLTERDALRAAVVAVLDACNGNCGSLAMFKAHEAAQAALALGSEPVQGEATR